MRQKRVSIRLNWKNNARYLTANIAASRLSWEVDGNEIPALERNTR